MSQTVAVLLTPAFLLNCPSLTCVRTLRRRHTAGFPGYPFGENTKFTFIWKSLIDGFFCLFLFTKFQKRWWTIPNNFHYFESLKNNFLNCNTTSHISLQKYNKKNIIIEQSNKVQQMSRQILSSTDSAKPAAEQQKKASYKKKTAPCTKLYSNKAESQ